MMFFVVVLAVSVPFIGVDSVFLTGYKFIVHPWFIYSATEGHFKLVEVLIPLPTFPEISLPY